MLFRKKKHFFTIRNNTITYTCKKYLNNCKKPLNKYKKQGRITKHSQRPVNALRYEEEKSDEIPPPVSQVWKTCSFYICRVNDP